ncbi:hypothetical protein HK101_004591 [Irineochytrium annulatum]|nr:hypothetical protein HK101_004591 [Irineochytrium annulatum]
MRRRSGLVALLVLVHPQPAPATALDQQPIAVPSSPSLPPPPSPSLPRSALPIPPEEIERIKLAWVPYAQSAYCLDGLEDWGCQTCGGLTSGTVNVSLFGEFNNSVFGFVAANPPAKHIAISFRGSRTMDNWIDDLMIAKPDCPFPGAPEGAKIHYGFLNSWSLVRDDVMSHVSRLLLMYPKFDIWFTGHSLGGALATLAAVDIRQTLGVPGFRLKLLTFAQPRVGNGIWADWVDSLTFDHMLRVVNQDDLTPHLPPSFAGFRHCPDEIWIADEDGTTLLCSDDNGDIPGDHHGGGDGDAGGGGGGGVDRGRGKGRWWRGGDADSRKGGNWWDGTADGSPPASVRSLDENKECANRPRWKYNVSRHTWMWELQVGIKACMLEEEV